METKACKKCGMEKDITEYHKGYAKCKECYNEARRKPIKEKLTSNKKEYYRNNYKKYYKENKERICNKKREYMRAYYVDNKEYFSSYRKKYMDDTNYDYNRRRNDFSYKLIKNIRNLIYYGFKRNGTKKHSKTEQILGCSFKEFKQYIINQFEDWMTFENHGRYTGNYNETWQIDHIIPASSATTTEDIIKLNHYTNLRPLCSRKNLEKRNHTINT